MDTFNRSNIYETVFFNVISVTEYKDLNEFIDKDVDQYQIWKKMAEKRYETQIKEGASLEDLYLDKACFLPEFSKIVSITYVTAKSGTSGKIETKVAKMEGDNEAEILYGFCMLLDDKFETERYTTLCGHNIAGHDIPLVVKRIIKHRAVLSQERAHTVPMLLKNYIKAKPWDSNIKDTINMWKFNGTDYISLELISEFMKLKKNDHLLDKDELNRYYWENNETNPEETLKKIDKQSFNYSYLAFQLVNELRQL